MLRSLETSTNSHPCPVLQLFTNTAAALPAEVGADGKMVRPAKQLGIMGFLGSKYEQAWARRVQAQKARQGAPN